MAYNRTLIIALQQLGLDPNKHLPAEGVSPRALRLYGQDITVWVLAKDMVKPGKHRTYAECPNCSQSFTLGCLAQHMYGNRKSHGKRQRGCYDVR